MAGKILIIEDEESIRNIIIRTLNRNGYETIAANNKQEATTIFEKEAENIDLIISDMVLKDGTGLEIIEQLSLRKPSLKVILCSGYISEEVKDYAVNKKGARFIQKPFNITDLLGTVRECLNKK